MTDLRKAHAEHGNNDSLRLAAEMAFTELCNQRDAHYTKDIPTELAQAIQALRQALAQRERSEPLEQKPVAWMNNDYEVFFDAGKAACYSMGWIKPLYTAPPSIEAAVSAEREACAKVCEEFYTIEGIAQKCAVAIRARGEK